MEAPGSPWLLLPALEYCEFMLAAGPYSGPSHFGPELETIGEALPGPAAEVKAHSRSSVEELKQ